MLLKICLQSAICFTLIYWFTQQATYARWANETDSDIEHFEFRHIQILLNNDFTYDYSSEESLIIRDDEQRREVRAPRWSRYA